MTYLKTTAVGFDMWCAGIFFDQDDVTVSSICGLVRRMDKGDKTARNLVMFTLQLHDWQIGACRKIGAQLERYWPGHCEAAIAADILRAKRAISLLA